VTKSDRTCRTARTDRTYRTQAFPTHAFSNYPPSLPGGVKREMAVTTAGELWRRTSPDEIAVSCPVCANTVFNVLLSPEEVENEQRWLTDFYLARGAAESKDLVEFTQCEPTHIVECRECGTVLRNPRPTAEALDRRYRHDRYGKQTLEQLLAAERDFFPPKALRYGASLPKEARVLEIGCFVGAFLLACRELEWNATGLDIGEETASFCRSMGLDVTNVDLATLSEEFDAVFIWNTFDQLAKPRDTLRKIRSRLRTRGLLVIRVPNGCFEKSAIAYRQSRPKSAKRVMAAMAYNNFLTFPYLTGYTPSSIRRMLDEEGFQICEIAADTILPLANETTAREEQRYKRAVMRICQLKDRSAAPWLDVVAISKR
jgi:2-polyprenyl-3-methyl-5-hydroxy-6-metoxy-1,4-benzoquinol methylase